MLQWLENNAGKVFVLLLVLVLFLLGVHLYTVMHPVGIHYIRQTDSLAFVDFYQNNGFNFFEPGGWFLGNSNGKTAGEFPILYYLTALMDLLTGSKHIILRLLTLTISLVGFYHLFKLCRLIFEDVIFAIGFALLFISSTVILYYSVNFLPDASALGLTLTAYYYAIKSQFLNEPIRYKKAFVLFAFAGLLKITFLIHPIALITAAFIFEWKNSGSFKSTIKSSWKRILGLAAIISIVFAWYIYAKMYNDYHHSNVFLTRILPIWDLDSEKIGRIWLAIRHDWFSSYYYQTTFHVLFILIIGSFFVRMKELSFLGILVLILGIGTLCYVLLFFNQFLDHDYYMLNAAPFVFILVLFSYQKLRDRFSDILNLVVAKIAVFLLVVLSFNYANSKLNERYVPKMTKFEKNTLNLVGIDSYLDELSIPKDAKFLIVGEETFNGAFYWMKRSGWVAKPSIEGSDKLMINVRRKSMDYIAFMPGFDGPLSSGFQLIGEHSGIKIYKNSQLYWFQSSRI